MGRRRRPKGEDQGWSESIPPSPPDTKNAPSWGIFCGCWTGPGEKRLSRSDRGFDKFALIDLYRAACHPASAPGLCALLMKANETINGWGLAAGSNLPLGGCAGTVAWIHDETLHPRSPQGTRLRPSFLFKARRANSPWSTIRHPGPSPVTSGSVPRWELKPRRSPLKMGSGCC